MIEEAALAWHELPVEEPWHPQATAQGGRQSVGAQVITTAPRRAMVNIAARDTGQHSHWANPGPAKLEQDPLKDRRSEQVSIRPRFAMKNNISHPQFGQVLEHGAEKRLIHHGQFTGPPAGIYDPKD